MWEMSTWEFFILFSSLSYVFENFHNKKLNTFLKKQPTNHLKILREMEGQKWDDDKS